MKISLVLGLLIFFLLVSHVQACINPGLKKESGITLNPFGGWLLIDGNEYEGLEIEYNLGVKNINNQGLLVSLQPSSRLKDYVLSEPVFVEAKSIKTMPLKVWVGGKNVDGTIDINYICEDGTPQFLHTYIYFEIIGKGIEAPPTSSCDSYGLDGCYSGLYRDYYCSNDELKYKESCMRGCCQLFGGEDSYCTSDRTKCVYPDPNEVLTVEIHSPENKIYGDRRFLINVSTNSTAKNIYYALNSNRFREVCQNCDSYANEYSAREGLNELIVRAETYAGKFFNETVTFFVDTKEPKISRIYPKNGEYIKGSIFKIKYSEENLESISLFYGTNSLNEYIENGCPPGRNKECEIEVDLSSFDGQEIQYFFVVRDGIHSSMSDVNTITVDSTPPTITINSPSSIFDYRRILVDVSISEQVASLEMSYGGKRFRQLCKNCDSYSRLLSFRDGTHELILKATDYAGNEGDASDIFTVDTKEPRVKRIYPENGEYTKGMTTFTVRYDEDNTESISLFYGSSPFNEVSLLDCPSGRNKECEIEVDVSSFDGEVSYYFLIQDPVHSVVSDVNKIIVDSTVPTVTIHSPENKTYDNYRVLMNVSVSEKVKSLEMSDNGGRFRTLCRNCDSYDRLRSFRYGTHNLTIKATDYAGNEGFESIVFTIER